MLARGDREAPWGARCFDGCDPADQKNSSSECWIRCFYNNVLGVDGTSRLVNYSSSASAGGEDE